MKFDIDASDIAQMGRGYLRAADLAPKAIAGMMQLLPERLEDPITALIANATKAGTESKPNPNAPNYEPGKLAESTVTEPTLMGMELLEETFQPAESHKNRDDSGGGFYYVQSVLGGRDAIGPMPVTSELSTGKRAMSTPDGPRVFVGDAKPRDYITPLQPELLSATSLIGMQWGKDVLDRLRGIL